MAELPAWVYDLVGEVQHQEEVHPKLFFTSGAFEGYRQYDWCSCQLMRHVPTDVQREARFIRSYLRRVTPEDQSFPGQRAGDSNSAENAGSTAEDGDEH